jgi:hypothetical protein
MVKMVVPDATKTDLDHFREMMDTNGDKIISREEFIALLDKSLATAEASASRSHTQLMSDLLLYIDQSKITLKDYFVKPPKYDGMLTSSPTHQSASHCSLHMDPFFHQGEWTILRYRKW